MSYYIKGGSNFNDSDECKVWLGLFLGGFPEADYSDVDWKQIDDGGHITFQDPFWRLGRDGGEKCVEVGLWDDYRIRICHDTGIQQYDPSTGLWEAIGRGNITTACSEPTAYKIGCEGLSGSCAEHGSGNFNAVTVWHDGTGGHIGTNCGDLTLEPAGSDVFVESRIWSAEYNDYADFWKLKSDEIIVPGMCYSETGNGLEITKKKADKACVGVSSDTWGHAIGNREKAVPIAVSGFVLAYVDDVYEPGTLLVPNKKGILTKASLIHILLKRVMAKYIKNEEKEFIVKFQNKIDINERHWVKVI
jgi:hypothetical protein